jgi:hypothetical protein
MKVLKFSIIAILLSFMTSCESDYVCYLPSDKGVVIGIEKVENGNRVTIKLIQNHKQSGVYTHVIFLTDKQYNINDTIYFKK